MTVRPITPLDEISLANVGKSEAFKLIHAEAKKAKEAALKKRRDDLQSNIGTRQDFIALVSNFLQIVETKWRNENNEVSKCVLENTKKWRESLSRI